MGIVETAALLSAAAVATLVVVRVDPAWTLSAGLAASVFTGNWDLLGPSFPIDRALLLAGLAVLVLRIGPAGDRPPLRFDGVHALLLAVLVLAAVSALWAGTLDEREARFDLLDRIGVVPFAMFAVAPVAFHDERRRSILLGTLVALGGYLGVTAVAEGTGADALVWPGYILDPVQGIHADRSRGPFLEAVPNGLALIACGAAAVMALSRWRDRLARAGAMAVVGLCLAGVSLTYTRSVWIGAAAGVVLVLAAYRDLRPLLVPVVASVAVGLAIAIAAIPGFGDKLADRYDAKGPVWVRQHTESAALRMVADRPIGGFGLRRFESDSRDYYRDIPEIKLTGYNEAVHNVVLNRFVEFGIPGGVLWVFALALAFGGAAFRRVRGELVRWQRGYVVVLVSAVVAAVLTPFGWPFPELLVATWAGLLLTRTDPEPVATGAPPPTAAPA